MTNKQALDALDKMMECVDLLQMGYKPPHIDIIITLISEAIKGEKVIRAELLKIAATKLDGTKNMPDIIYLIQPQGLDETEIIWTTAPDCYDGAAATQYTRTALTQPNQAQPVNKMMLDALQSHLDYLLDNEGFDEFRESGTFCEHVKMLKKAITAASSAPVVEVEGLSVAQQEKMFSELGEAFDVRDLNAAECLTNYWRKKFEAARIQLARQKGGE